MTVAHEEAAALFARFDPMPHSSRTRAIAEYTRSLDESRYRALHTVLDAGGADERWLAFFLAVVRRDLDVVTRALTDPLLRRRALAAAVRLPVPDEALAAVALSDVRAVRQDAYRVLRLSRRRSLAGRLLPDVLQRYGEQDAARLLPACAPDTVGTWLPRLSAVSGVPEGVLKSLARTAPAAVAAHLAALHEAADTTRRTRLRRHCPRLVDTLTARDPAAGMLLLERAPELLTERACVVLLRDPAGVARSLRRTGARRLPLVPEPLPRRVLRALHGLDRADVRLLAKVCASEQPWPHGMPHPAGSHPVLALLDPAERRCIVEAWAKDNTRPWISGQTSISALAPADRRELVGGWLKGRAGRRTLPRVRLAALLPLADGEPLLRELTGAHRCDERALAWPALLGCAALEGDPDAYARVLSSCERAWHDQEEVRRAALAQAAATPAALLDAVPFGALRDAALTAVQSRDSTAGTLAAAERWLRRTAESAARAGDTRRAAAVALLLGRVVADPRRPGDDVRPLSLDRVTAEAVEATVVGAEVVGARVVGAEAVGARGAGAEAARGMPGVGPAHRIVTVAALLAPHLPVLPALDEALGRIARRHPDRSLTDQSLTDRALRDRAVIERAAALWVSAPATRESRCAELIAADASFVTVPVVLRTLTARRTDLLDTVLGGSPPPHWVPRLRRRVTGRWLPRQRALFDAHLGRVAVDEEAPLRERSDAAALLGDPDVLTSLAAEAPQPVAAAALTALGSIAADSGGASAHPRTVALLLDHAAVGGVRGRAAMTGLRELLATVPDEEAVAVLTPVLNDVAGPVGSRKEAARALAALPGRTGFAALLAAWDAPGQHRDVLAVMASALVARIHEPAVRARLAARLGSTAVREAALAAWPAAPPARAGFAAFLAGLVRTADAEVAQTAARALEQGAPSAVLTVLDTLAAAVSDTDRPASVRGRAARILCRRAGTAAVLDALRAACGDLVGQARGGPDEDRRAALRVLDATATGYDLLPPPAHDVLATALLDAGLPGSAAGAALQAAVASLRENDPAPGRWRRWLAVAGDSPGRAGFRDRLRVAPVGPPSTEAVHSVVAVLREEGSVLAGLAAVQLVREAGSRTRWAEPWPARLAELRASPHPDVAEAALLADLYRTA
ncbi:hypothetical protein [Streptomyces sp. NPDC047928]|uniref:hypothetical protein n=1 Tax=unclassified Streptomyces TaxID=2593676 RepID=UPI00371A96C1